MRLFHGSYSNTAPVIKVGAYALGTLDNVFDGVFASADAEIAGSHGGNVYAYTVASIADSSILNERIEEVITFLDSEVEADYDTLDALASAIADDDCESWEQFESILAPRSCADAFAAVCWEMQRLRGRVAAHLGYDAVEMDDEHGTSYLIVNPSITAEE
ncbi:hypothetical protein [Serratia marcescens]|uniref:hypothetical protein n=1 Tax=Serratia marcescens TaxID=615 RepID=UPI000E1D782E|nr:hypothetical protein [Serratia marcescens]AXK23893.1 Hypothetical protein SmN45_2118 [Serratia marcescens]